MALFGKSDPDLQGWNLTQFYQADPSEFDLWLGSRVVWMREEGKLWSEILPAEAARWLPVFIDLHGVVRVVMDAAADGDANDDDDFEKASAAAAKLTALVKEYILPPVVKMGVLGLMVAHDDFPDAGRDVKKKPGETDEGAWLMHVLLKALVDAIEEQTIRRCPVCESAFIATGKRKDAVYCSNRDGAILRNRRSRKRKQEKTIRLNAHKDRIGMVQSQ